MPSPSPSASAIIRVLCYLLPGRGNSRSDSSRGDTDNSQIEHWMLFLRAIRLFTFSDLKTIVGPMTAFGILHAFCVDVFSITSVGTTWTITSRIPIVVFWTWINLLPFTIDNQRQPAAVLEDSINKPWRPIPTKLVSGEEAKRMMLILYVVAFGSSICLGGLRQHLALIILGYLYNDCAGADRSSITRNLINGLGFVCYGSGAMEVALGVPLPIQPSLVGWFLVIALMVFTTVHTQDMYDQKGDKARGRWTVPLSVGDTMSRWTIAVAMTFWIVYCPLFWKLSYLSCGATVLSGAAVVIRTLIKRVEKQDQVTFRMWNFWMITLYAMPLIKKTMV